MKDNLIVRLRNRSATQPENFGLDDEAADRIEAQAARIAECDSLLSRVLHELAGAASLCWEPKPTGVFNSEVAIAHVEAAIHELRAALAPKESSE